MELATRATSIEASRTGQLLARVRALMANGTQVLNLGVGEPDCPSPPGAIQATKQALDQGRTRYSANAGLHELKSLLAEDFSDCTADNVVITNGSKQALYSLFQILCNPGDEVLLPTPCWVSFSEQIRLAGARPVWVPTRAHQLDPAALEAAITPQTRAMVINSPNNPTGAVYPPSAIAEAARLAMVHDLVVISDEAYEAFTYDSVTGFSPFAIDALRPRLVVVRSFSKRFAMTGFRVGYCVGPRLLMDALARVQSHLCGNVCTFAQYGALGALQENGEWVAQYCRKLERRRDLAFQRAAALFDCIKPRGAFYLFPDIRRVLGPHGSAESFAGRLLEAAHVAVMPGEAFGADGHIRISYAVSRPVLEAAFDRMERFVKTA
jgi:aspartate aminotransferase